MLTQMIARAPARIRRQKLFHTAVPPVGLATRRLEQSDDLPVDQVYLDADGTLGSPGIS